MMLFLFIVQVSVVTSSGSCRNDTNKDHRPRVSCMNKGLSTVPGEVHSGTEVLVLSENHFLSVSWSSYMIFTHLHELDLNLNLINSVQAAGPVLPNLHVLRLSNNKLSALGPKAFSPAPNLMEIYLDRNALRILDESTFSDLPHLEVINLSQNELHALPPRLLQLVSSSTLKTFDLESNQVQQLPDDFFISKPELPYVYLSQNSWVCTCLVGYLQRFLDDQGHNVYRHTGTTSIENDPESVVCATPAELEGRAIVDLKEDEFCRLKVMPSFAETYPSSEDYFIIKERTSKGPVTLTTVTPTTIKPTMGSSTVPTMSTSANPTSTATTPLSLVITEPVTPNKTLPTTPTTTSTTTPTTVQVNVPTTGLSNVWTRLESWTMFYVWTFRSDRHPTATQQTFLGLTKATPYLEHPKLPSGTHPSTTAPPVHTSAYGGPRRSVSWCWWLFITFLLLSILSGIFSCILLLWLIVTYIKLYQPIRRQLSTTKKNENVTLMKYKIRGEAETSTMDLELQENLVPFLPQKMIRDIQPVFRSVLFISKEDEDEDENIGSARCDAETEIYPVPTVTLRRGGDEAVKDRKEVFRKTLYRLISREEEIVGWREVEESSWGVAPSAGAGPEQEGSEEQGKTRYSLILREERRGKVQDRKSEVELLMGEWEMGRAGGGDINRLGWRSLVRRIEGWSLPDSAPPDTP